MEDNNEKKIPQSAHPKNKKKEETIILRLNSLGMHDDDIKVLEEKYTEKFGCKVVILENNLTFVESI